jgi:threonine dehydrogenase-like Zn-dependent dehydrogenase
MRSALLLAPRRIEVRDVDAPTLAEQDVLIRPVRAGVCGSDVSFYVGHRQPPWLPFTIGHELVGHIVSVGARVTKFSVGQRVIVEPNYTCGHCRFCREGRGNICPNKKSLGVSIAGCFAEYVTAPQEFTWPVPDTVSDVDAASIEPQAVSLHALLQSGARAGETVAVVGCGVVGLLLAHAAVARGVRVLAYDQFAAKLAMASALGAIADDQPDPTARWLDEGVTTVFECAGATATVERSIASAPRGSIVMLLGLSTAPASFVPLRVVREGIRIEPSLIYDHPADFEATIRLVADGTLSPSKIVTGSLPFESVGDALEMASTGRAGKIHVVFH